MSTRLQQSLGLAGSLIVAACIAGIAWRQASHEESMTLNLGPVPLNASRDFEVSLHNVGTDSQVLRTVTPSCTCLAVLTAPGAVPAQGSVVVKVRFKPEKPGTARADLQVDWDVAAQRTWHIVAEVIPPPEALPSSEAIAAARQHLGNGVIMAAAAAVTAHDRDRIIIDVRPSSDYQQASIKGAMNLPLAQLSTLPADMHGKPLLVVDKGLATAATLDLISQLRSKGWRDLHVLEGGLPGWVANGGALGAAMPTSARLVDASEARQCCTRPGWITAAPRQLAASWHVRELMPDLMVYDSSDKPEQIARTLGDELRRRRPGDGATTSVLHLLLATESGENARAISEALQATAAGTPVFILNGGLRGYLDHLHSLRPAAANQWTTLADYRGELADLRARQRMVSACSSCPR